MSSQALVGNAVCLDYANTVNVRPNPARDRLDAPGAAWGWAADAGLLAGRPPDENAGGDSRREQDEQDLRALRSLRQAVWETFDAVVDGQPLPDRPFAALLRTHHLALPRAAWRLEGGAARPVWPPPARLGDLAGPVADSAVALLRGGPLGRVGRCPLCNWLFLDTSKNGGRRWCSMATCGSRLKTARYAAKSRPPGTRRAAAADRLQDRP